MKFLVIGTGSIGQRHIENLRRIDPSCFIDAYDVKSPLTQKLKKLKIHFLTKSEIYKKKYDCVFVCTPPNSHIKLAINAIKSGSNVFIEKPLSANGKNLQKLENLIKKKKLIAFVGYNFRFNQAINTIKNLMKEKKFGKLHHASSYFGYYLPYWRPSQDYVKNYSSRYDLGGGIIHDSSHELDYLRFLLGKPKSVQSSFTKISTLKTDVEGIADIILEFKKNTFATIHLDFIRKEYKRSLELIFENGIISWSFSNSQVRIFNPKSKSWSHISIKDSINKMYYDELIHVIRCIKSKKQSNIINLQNGIKTFTISEQILKSGKIGKKIILD